MTSSKLVFAVFHPDYFIDLLRAGGRFPLWNTFQLPSHDATQQELKDFVINKFPLISEDRYEIWIKFSFKEEKSNSSLSLEDIESAHFYNIHRQEATNLGVFHTLNVYGIEVGEPLDEITNNLFEVYSSVIREHTASTIVRAWFPETQISSDFISQVEIGYKYQQSSAPDKLDPIPANMIWAHMVSYNAGLRKFDERPNVLWLQDIQEVIKRTDTTFKQELKIIGEKHSSKFSDLLDNAEESRKSGLEPSKWVLQNLSNKNTYLNDLDLFLSQNGKLKSFFYTALLYLNWREKVLDSDYNGALGDHSIVGYFLKKTTDLNLRQSVAEALFTIIYAGGPRVFQKALIEARKRYLNIVENESDFDKVKDNGPTDDQPSQNLLLRVFANAKKNLGKLFTRIFDEFSDEKKKELLKEIKVLSLSKIKIAKGDFSFEQYSKLCLLFGIPAEQFEQDPLSISIISDADNINIHLNNGINTNDLEISDANNIKQIEEEAELKSTIDSELSVVSKNDQTFVTGQLNSTEKSKKSKSGNSVKTHKSKKVKKPVENIHPEINFPDAEITNSEMDKK